MAEIRDFLIPITVPNISSSNFAIDFEAFCVAVKDNINKIVSAPFLKGDRGSRVRIKNEYLKLQVDSNGTSHEEWSDFAKCLVRSIYGDHPGSVNPDLPLPLMDIDETHPDGLIIPDDDDWETMLSIDGGYASPAVIGYEFELFDDASGETSHGTGKMKVLSSTDTTSVISIVEHSGIGISGREFIIGSSEENFDSETYYQLVEQDSPVNLWMKIGDKINLHGDDENDFEMFFSYDIFKNLEYIPVCYDEDSGKKFLCVPFYFFDGRLNYVGYMDWTLSLFHDMSVTVFGEATLEFQGDNPTKEEIEDPNCWVWSMETTNAFPKLYYNVDLKQFCWEIAGEQTNIIAQGLKGDKGESANIWVCEGSVTGGTDEESILINRILAPYDDMPISNIQSGDLIVALYDDNEGMAEPGEEPPYRRVQFGIAHVSGQICYIDYKYNCEIIHKLRNYSLHDYLRSIGVDPNGDDSIGGVIAALYTLERGSRANAMAMWASRWDSNTGEYDDDNHFIAPITLGKTSGNLQETDKNTLSNKILNILYDDVVFKKTIHVDNIISNNGMNTNAVGVLQNPISGNYLKEYRLGVLCNVLSARKSDNPVTGRMGEGLIPNLEVSDENPSPTDIVAKSTSNFLYIECELIVGWIPSIIADIFNDNLSDNRNTPTLDIYRAQKYHLYVRVPVSGSNNVAAISLDGHAWSHNIYLNTITGSATASSSLSHKGSGRNLSISIDNSMVFEENIKQENKTEVDSWFNNATFHIQNRLTGYLTSGGREFFYEYRTPKGFLCKDKIKYSVSVSNNSYCFYLNQFRLSGGQLRMSAGGDFNVDNLIWFGSRNTSSSPIGYRDNTTSESLLWPLTDDGYSFLNYFKSGQNNYIRTTNDEGNYMWQGRILSANPKNSNAAGKKQDLYYINTSFYETLYPAEFFTFIVKNPDLDTYNASTRHISRVPINSAIHIYPEGICGLAYDRVVTTSENQAWGPDIVNPAQAASGTYVPSQQVES